MDDESLRAMEKAPMVYGVSEQPATSRSCWANFSCHGGSGGKSGESLRTMTQYPNRRCLLPS